MTEVLVPTSELNTIRYNPNYLSTPTSALFDPENNQLQAQPVTQGGRNAAWFIVCDQQPAVLRHYKRGGLIAKIISQSYFWTGAAQTRSWAEYAVLLHLRNSLVAVPEPIAAWWQRQGFFYRAAIIVARIPNALPIAHQLETTCAKAVALVVKKMHDAGVWHADLNVFNILIDDQQCIYLIDFDKAKVLGVVDSKHRENNLLRLRRSLIKVRGEMGQQWYEQFNQAYLKLSKS